MIAFACSHCGTKLKVRDEFGGRHSKCPSCKAPLVVPSPSTAVSAAAPEDTNVVDLMLALRRSLGAQKGASRPAAAKARPKKRAARSRKAG